MCLHLELKTIGNTLFIIKTQKKDFAIANSQITLQKRNLKCLH